MGRLGQLLVSVLVVAAVYLALVLALPRPDADDAPALPTEPAPQQQPPPQPPLPPAPTAPCPPPPAPPAVSPTPVLQPVPEVLSGHDRFLNRPHGDYALGDLLGGTKLTLRGRVQSLTVGRV